MAGIGGGKSKGKSGSRDSELSEEQAKILKSREAKYQKYFFPAMLGELQETEGTGLTPQLAQTSLSNINQAYQGAQVDVNRSLAQRGITGGFQKSALVQLEASRAGAAADAVTKAYLQNKDRRSGLIGQAVAGSPVPTTSAEYHRSSKESSWDAKASIG
jgi:hypothetical protein